MNFVNLKKLFVLSSALIAFGNTSYASDMKYGIDYNSGNYNNVQQNDNININSVNEIMDKIKEGIVKDINSSGKKDEIWNRILSGNSLMKYFVEENYENAIESIISNRKIGMTGHFDIDRSFDLIFALGLIKYIDSIKQDLKIEDKDSGFDPANNPYSLFKKFALEISSNNMEQLKNKLLKLKEESLKENNEDSFFIKTLEEVSHLSTLKVEEGNLDSLNVILTGENAEFVVSPNHKIHYCKTKKDYREYDSKNIKGTRNNILEQIMDVVNTEFAMTNSEYILLSSIASSVAEDNLKKIKDNPAFTTRIINSPKEFLELLKGDIFNQQALVKKDDGINHINNNQQDNNNSPIVDNNNNPQLNNDGVNVKEYYIKDITEALKNNGFKITNIVGSKVKPNINVKPISLNQKNDLLKINKPCTIVLDATTGKGSPNKGVMKAFDRINVTEIGQLVHYESVNNELRKLLLVPENNYIILTIDII